MPLRIIHNPRPEDFTYNVEHGNGELYPLVKIGRHSYGHEFFVHWEGEVCQVEIGRYTSIAPRVRFFAGQEHHTEWGTTYPFQHLPLDWPELRSLTGHPVSRGNVVVGSDVWIGYGALIRSGVTVHHGAVVGMGAVVTEDVPPYAIVAGNPAKVVRYRFDSSLIAGLLDFAWWDCAANEIREIAERLSVPFSIATLKELQSWKEKRAALDDVGGI